MPALEIVDLLQTAVLWAAGGIDAYGQERVQYPVEIPVRWTRKRGRAVDPQGNTITVDGFAIVEQKIAIGSIMRLGTLDDWYSTGSQQGNSELMEVKTYQEASDLRNMETRRKLGLMRYRDTLPNNFYLLKADAGSYAVAGGDTDFERSTTNRTLTAAAGVYFVFGNDFVTFSRTYRLTAQAGTHTLVGRNTALFAGLGVPLDGGSYAVVGRNVQFLRTYVFRNSGGDYNVSGRNANLTRGYLLQADVGSYGVSGRNANLTKGYYIAGSRGNYGITGRNANLTHP
jgi:hypothetical protein